MITSAKNKNSPPRFPVGGLFHSFIVTRSTVLCRPGSDLLFQVLRLSTIGAGEFNGRVRDGIGFRPLANTTKPAKDRNQMSVISNQITNL